MIKVQRNPQHKCTCPTCGSVLLFEDRDIKTVTCDDYVMKMTIITKYIMCPKCDEMLILKETGRDWY